MKFAGIRYLLFDLDGTLIDSSEGITRATNAALEALGEPPRTKEEIQKFIGYPLETMFKAFSHKSYHKFWESFQAVGLDEIAASAIPLAGTDSTLRMLYGRGYRLGIGTQKMRVHVGKILHKLGWADLIGDYIGSDDVTRGKPDPEIYIRLMQKMGGRISESIIIGDTINDLLAARAAGIPIIMVRSPFGHDNELVDNVPDLHIENIAELLDHLK